MTRQAALFSCGGPSRSGAEEPAGWGILPALQVAIAPGRSQAHMLVDLHALMQNADNNDTVVIYVIENDVVFVMMGAGRRLKFGTRPAKMWVIGDEPETRPEAFIISFSLSVTELAI